MILCLHVDGLAHPQGSKRHVGNGRIIESNPNIRKWRATLTAHAVAEIIHKERQGARYPLTGPATLIVAFHFPRPQYHYSRAKGREHQLLPSAPRLMQTGPDLDKLVRAVGDALTDAGAIVDDKQIQLIRAAKKWAGPGEDPYVSIQLEGTHP